MTQTIYEKLPTGRTQEDRILRRLIEANGAEVSMPELARIGAGHDYGFCIVHSRIAGLRKCGHNIAPARTEKVDGQVHSYYRIIPNT